jgi:hypothetical protein
MPSGLAPVVLVADWFMGAMLSRPGGLSLRRAWVTPATLALAGALAAAGAFLGGVLAWRGGWAAAGGAAFMVVSAASIAVVVAGVAQRVVRG